MKLAPLRKLHRLHYLLPASEVITDGIVEVHSVSHSFPMHGCKGSVWLDGSGKVGRQAVSGGIFLLRSVFNPKTLPLPAIRLKSIRQRKQATDGNGLQTKRDFDAPSVSRSSLLFAESPLLMQLQGRRQTALLQENQVAVSR